MMYVSCKSLPYKCTSDRNFAESDRIGMIPTEQGGTEHMKPSMSRSWSERLSVA